MKALNMTLLALTLIIVRYLLSYNGMDIPWWVIIIFFIIIGAQIDD